MAADTREQESPTSLKAAPHSAPRKSEEACAVPLSPPNANALPAGAGLNTAGGKGKEASYLDALKSVQLNELQEVHKKPCVRDAFLTGIGSGFGIGGVRAITGGLWLGCSC